CSRTCTELATGLAARAKHRKLTSIAATDTRSYLATPACTGFVKCNIDAAIFHAEKMVGMGARICDEGGNFIAAITANVDTVMTAAEGEAWSLYQGMQWIVTLGYNKVIFELDCKMVVDDVNNMRLNLSEYVSIIQDSLTL
ncbi:60S ribosomal protein L23, partial [Trifolium medium]|nr:60S ribosomal protein L23 [Trifolium medium]